MVTENDARTDRYVREEGLQTVACAAPRDGYFERALTDLRGRLDETYRSLMMLAADTDNATELLRLEAKASGVTLAAGYAREALSTARMALLDAALAENPQAQT